MIPWPGRSSISLRLQGTYFVHREATSLCLLAEIPLPKAQRREGGEECTSSKLKMFECLSECLVIDPARVLGRRRDHNSFYFKVICVF